MAVLCNVPMDECGCVAVGGQQRRTRHQLFSSKGCLKTERLTANIRKKRFTKRVLNKVFYLLMTFGRQAVVLAKYWSSQMDREMSLNCLSQGFRLKIFLLKKSHISQHPLV